MELFKQIMVYAVPIISLLALCWSIFVFCYFHHKYKLPKEKPVKVKKIAPKKIKAHKAVRVFVYDKVGRAIHDFTCDNSCKAKKQIKKIFDTDENAVKYETVKIKIKK